MHTTEDLPGLRIEMFPEILIEVCYIVLDNLVFPLYRSAICSEPVGICNVVCIMIVQVQQCGRSLLPRAMSNSADVCFYLLTVLISISSGIDNHSASIQVGVQHSQVISLLCALFVEFYGMGVHGHSLSLCFKC